MSQYCSSFITHISHLIAMNSFLGLRTCIYRVPDLAAATEWYAKVLGFQPYFNEPFYVGFNVGGYELGLQPLPAVALATEGPAVALAKEGPAVALAKEGPSIVMAKEGPASAKATADKENIETYWGVDDIQATFAHLLACGATAKDQPDNVGEEIWVATVKDPWGNILGIIKNPHFQL